MVLFEAMSNIRPTGDAGLKRQTNSILRPLLAISSPLNFAMCTRKFLAR
jgi:hypothetical protein